METLVLEKKIFQNFHCIFIVSLLYPLGKRQSPSFEKKNKQTYWIPFTQGQFVPSLVKIGSMILEKNIFK
jgi:hypothetical protein